MHKPIINYKLPNKDTQNYFGAKRKFEYHTGVDLFCEIETNVYSMFDGIVLNIEKFTGFTESPWWHDTYAILIYHPEINKTILYGELNPIVNINDKIKEGQLIGHVLQVLKKDKGLPMTMLHIELYKDKNYNSVWWKLDQEKPNNLEDITIYL